MSRDLCNMCIGFQSITAKYGDQTFPVPFQMIPQCVVVIQTSELNI